MDELLIMINPLLYIYRKYDFIYIYIHTCTWHSCCNKTLNGAFHIETFHITYCLSLNIDYGCCRDISWRSAWDILHILLSRTQKHIGRTTAIDLNLDSEVNSSLPHTFPQHLLKAMPSLMVLLLTSSRFTVFFSVLLTWTCQLSKVVFHSLTEVSGISFWEQAGASPQYSLWPILS